MRPFFTAVVVLVLPAVTLAQEKVDKPILVLEAGGHTAKVSKILFTPDGKELISVSNDKTIRVWDAATGEILRVLRLPIDVGPWGELYAAALSPNGKTLAVGGAGPEKDNSGAIYLISLADGTLERVIRGHKMSIFSLAFSPDGKLLASGSADKTARLWDVTTGDCRQTLSGHTNFVKGVIFSPDGRHVATASHDQTGRIWSAQTGESEVVLRGHDKEVDCAAWSPDGKTLATGGRDQTIRLWNADGTARKTFGKLGSAITSLTFTTDSRKVLFTRGMGRSHVCSLLDLGSGEETVRFTQHTNTVYDGTLSPDGTLAATTGGNGYEIYLWDTRGATVALRLASKGRAAFSSAWGLDGQTIAWGNNNKGSALKLNIPLERSFQLRGLEAATVPDENFRRAQPTRGTLSLEATGRLVVSVRRGDKTVADLKLHQDTDIVRCFTLLSDDQAVVGSSYNLLLFDTHTGKILRSFKGHMGEVWAVAPSPDNRYLLSASTDQTLRIWTLDRNAPLLSLFFAGNEWVAWTPEGYYAASPGGEKLMGWQVNNGHDKMATFYPAAQFRKTLYRPDVIKLLLQEGSVEKALAQADKALGKVGALTEVEKVLPPKVTITTPDKTGLELKKPELEVKATAASVGDNPVTAMRLLLDGRPYEGQAGVRPFAQPKLGAVEASWTVQLTPGKHSLAVQADSAVSQGLSEAVEVILEGKRGLGAASVPLPDQVDPSELPNLYVLAVGVSAYKGDLKLQFAAKDAETLAQVCKDKTKTLFGKVEVKLVTDDKATRKEILQGLTWLRKEMTQRDVAILFFAGHGQKDADGSFYLLPVDGDPQDLLSTAVGDEQLKKTLAAVPGKIMMLLDACHAGAVGGDKRRATTAPTDDLMRDLVTDDYGVIVMCSSMGREYSVESSTVGHGYFTLALVEGLSGKAANKEGVVYLHTLDAYVTDRVKELSKGQQHPVTVKPTTIRSFPLAKP